jgi:multidrug efflux system membrane fusion protein
VPGIPIIQRELNWVHIAQRFPVRIHIDDPQPADAFRVGASAVTIIRGNRNDAEPSAER